MKLHNQMSSSFNIKSFSSVTLMIRHNKNTILLTTERLDGWIDTNQIVLFIFSLSTTNFVMFDREAH